MKICPKCKTQSSKKFCGECGKELVEVIICRRKNEDGSTCENVLTSGQKFCEECGKPVEEKERDDTEPDTILATMSSAEATESSATEHSENEEYEDTIEEVSDGSAHTEARGQQTDRQCFSTSLDGQSTDSKHSIANQDLAVVESLPSDHMEVQFHVILSPEIGFDRRCDEVFLHIFDEFQATKMTSLLIGEKEIKDNNQPCLVFQCNKTFPRSKVISYRYYVQRKSTKEPGISWSSFYEYLDSSKSGGKRRTLNIPSMSKHLDTWSQFDGFIYKKQQSSSILGISLFWQKASNFEILIELFGHTIVRSFSENPSKMIQITRQKCAHLLKCLQEISAGNKKKMCLKLWSLFESLIQCIPQERDKDIERDFCALALLILLYKDHDIPIEETTKTNICHWFMIKGPWKNKTVKKLEVLLRLDPDCISDFYHALLHFSYKVQEQSKNPSWMYLVPYVHFINQESHPFEKAPRDMRHDAKVPSWWGIKEQKLKHTVDAFKSKIGKKWPSTCSLKQLCGSLKSLLDVDYLLPRTVIAALNHMELAEAIETNVFPAEVCCAAIIYHLKTPADENADQYILKAVEAVEKVLKEQKSVNEDSRWLKANISSQLLSEATKKEGNLYREIVQRTAKIFIWNIDIYDGSVRQDVERDASEKENNSDCIKDACGKIIAWIKKQRFNVSEEIEVWNNLVEKGHSEAIQQWNNTLTTAMQESLEKRIEPNEQTEIVLFYCKVGNMKKNEIKSILSTIVQTMVKEIELVTCLENWTEYEKMNLVNLVTITFSKEWEKKESVHKRMDLEVLVKWQSLPVFVKVLGQDVCKRFLSMDVNAKLQLMERTMKNATRSIQAGTISIKDLETLSDAQHKEIFLDLATFFKLEDVHIRVKATLEMRVDEFNWYKYQRDSIRQLYGLCEYMPSVNTKPIDDILKKEEAEDCALNDVVKVKRENEFSNTDRDITIASDCVQLLELLEPMNMYKKSQCFQLWWKEECQRQKEGSCKNLEDVLINVMKPLKKRLNSISQGIQDGKIMFRQMEELFGKLYNSKYECLREELMQICEHKENIDKRIEQMKKYRSHKNMNDLAHVMMELKDEYGLQGNFEPIQNILSQNYEDIAFKDYEESLTLIGDFLEDITQEKISCLRVFVRSSKLVQWLRETMKESDLSELSVFVDLATIMAGEDVEKIAIVKSLLAGATGYKPLIFDIAEGNDYNQVIKMVKAVWKTLQEESTIPENLLFANQHLQWFKLVKETHGEVEVTSFMEADTINKFGIFTIETNVGKKLREARHTVTTNMALSDVIKLTIPADEAQGRMEVKEYTLGELESLQSKLMLIAGEEKGKERSVEKVERFTMVLDGVIRLSQIYTRMVSSGCVLFKNFAIKLFCEPNLDQPVCVILDFKNGDNLKQLKCRKTKEDRLENIMPKVASQMEKCLKDWREFVDRNRVEHPHLNYFTMDQLVIIQKEIARICLNESPSPKLYSLLHIVKRNCNKVDVQKANQKAVQIIEKEDREQTADGDRTPCEEDDVKRNDFIKKLTTAKFGPLVPYALEKFPDFNKSKAMAWCLKNKNKVKELEAERRSKMPEGGYLSDNLATGNTQQKNTIDTLISRAIADGGQYDRCESMLQKFEVIWKEFIQAIISNLRDFISLKQLGILLRHLAYEDDYQLKRTLPEPYDQSLPNLVICQEDEILLTTLSVYMNVEDSPLPQSDEVLMCSADTTLEQVDVFLQRSIFFSSGKIHCLVSADLMDFNVCDQLYDLLQEYMGKVNAKEEYRLIIICGSEKEHSLSMISSLEKYRKHPVILDPGRVKDHINKKLKFSVEDKAGAEKGAATVDFERSTVRIIQSKRSGVGKTLYKTRTEDQLKKLTSCEDFKGITLPLHKKSINMDFIVKRLLKHTEAPEFKKPRLFHIDVTNEVQEGVDFLLFNLLILGCLVDKNGYVWRKSPYDLYLIETIVKENTSDKKEMTSETKHQMLSLLPAVTCRSPQESVSILENDKPKDYKESDQLFDKEMYESDLYQKPYVCLKKLNPASGGSTSPKDCLKTLLGVCRVKNPSWSEMYHFVSFLHSQLVDFENNVFVKSADLPGFDIFVKKFLIQMSKDFSSRSLNMSEESNEYDDTCEEELKKYQMQRTWESSPHPYLFFNADHISFTFIGFYIERSTGNVIDLQTKTVLEKNIMERQLYDMLKVNDVPVTEDFDKLSRLKKIERLCMVMGIEPLKEKLDPDKTYELTTDNVKKMMAIYMRFRCNIPVIIMGETGCGKTRLVKFLCDLMASGKMKDEQRTQNMIIVKVHGGTTNKEIISKVKQAEKLAEENLELFGEYMYTVLFFDEANTTESIGLLKEIMCDKTVEGKPISLCKNLKLVAACNPYRRHPENLIQKLEKAGLGYHVHASKTADRLGRIPMRRLVYRVQPLPQSLHPFIWDFGQLTTEVERLYIKQMVKRYVAERRLTADEELIKVISEILTQSQEYMRNLKDECSFVSLRDVDRVLQIMCWFNTRSDTFFLKADEKLEMLYKTGANLQEYQPLKLSKVTRSLVLALGVCYHACLSDRKKYREFIAKFFNEPCCLTRGPEQIQEEIDCCQEAIIDAVSLKNNIARNLALKENVFMMIVCIELRIPLFLVGKPGSSKSLARLTVADALQGSASKHELFREMKQVQMLSFQCSPHTMSDGISSVFRQCAVFQKNNNLDKFVSVVVLDEVGLAEDSPKLPLKTLHPLLEDGCQGDELPEPYKKVGFIGISNWALDPAKMNRGIFVQRNVPDPNELKETAKGICQKSMNFPGMDRLVDELTQAYLKVFQEASKIREFYGLRDFYCLLKMINKFVDNSKRLPSFHQLRFALRRNFSGLEKVKSVDIFLDEVKCVPPQNEPNEDDPDDSLRGMIDSCITDTDSRHLLLLVENFSALATFQQHFLARKTYLKTNTIFGSSFRRDQEYTQVCRNINRIKNCMETGKTVILLNCENLYESLYEALNQYYVNFGGQSYVDLGLGTHRVKCPVHPNFKLIVVAEKKTVYDEFPIPLINRLEKHILTSKMMLSNIQMKTARELLKRTEKVIQVAIKYRTQKDIGKVVIGFHDDACADIVLQVWDQQFHLDENEHRRLVLASAMEVILWCAVPDAIVRIGASTLPEKDEIQEIYWKKQRHEDVMQYLQYQIIKQKCKRLLAQVTTHGKLLTSVHQNDLTKATGIQGSQILLLESLTTFDSEQHFNNKIRDFLHKAKDTPVLLVIQCDSGEVNANLIACARHSVLDECEKEEQRRTTSVHIVFIVQLTAASHSEFKSIQCGNWHSVHIDHLHSIGNALPSFYEMQGKSIASLIDEAAKGIVSQYNDTTDDENQQTRSNKQCLDLKQVLALCVQRAMTLVRDTGESGFSITNRILQLLNLLQRSNDFARGMGILLVRLLEDKDNSCPRTTVENWLSTEAATVEKIQVTGTLRRACLQTIEQKLSPILAAIIAVVDTNKNINILGRKTIWKEELWVRMLNKTEIFEFTYRDIALDTKDKEETDFVVHSTGLEGHIFQSRMPFSWLLSKKIADILKCDRQFILEDGKRDALAEAPILQLLMTVPRDCHDEAIDCYIHDFVNTVYTSAEDEMKIVCEMVKDEMKKITVTAEDETLALQCIDVHIAYGYLSERLKYFREINHVWLDCSKKILAIPRLEENHILRKEKCKDRVIQAVYLLIEDLSPRDEPEKVFDNQPSRAMWLVNVHRTRYVVQQTLKFYTMLDLCDESKSVLKEARSMWSRVVVMQLFVEHICKSSSEENITIELCCPLWVQMVEDNIDMKSAETIDVIVEYLKSCFGLAKDEYENKKERCNYCSKEITEKSRILPCKHVVCDFCIQTMKRQPEEMFCPTCQSKVEASFFKTDSLESRFILGKDKLADYKRRCTIFFMEIVSQLCFADNQLPEPEVIEKLMCYSLDPGTKTTGVDSNHAFRAFIFRLLIRTSERDFRHQLEKYLNQNKTQICEEKDENRIKEEVEVEDIEGEEDEANEETSTKLNERDELMLIITYCIEDNLMDQSSRKKSHPAQMTLDNVMELLFKKDSVIDQLEGIARTRMFMTEAAKCIHLRVCKRSVLSKDEEELLSETEAFCKKTNETGIWKYILRYLYSHYGYDALMSTINSDSPVSDVISSEIKSKVNDRIDRYLSCGKVYVSIKNYVQCLDARCRRQEVTEFLQKESIPYKHACIYFQMAVYWESVLSPRRENLDQIQKGLSALKDYDQKFGNKAIINALANDKLEEVHVDINYDPNETDVSIKSLAFQWICILLNIEEDSSCSVLNVLIELYHNPKSFEKALLPTMEQDDMPEILKLFGEELPSENHKVYLCKNGHPYVIKDCGKPWVKAKCVCGEIIGGALHKLEASNKEGDRHDATKRGHILGRPEERKIGPEVQRDLAPINCACVRFFLHLTMYAACTKQTMEDVRALIKLDIGSRSPAAFLKQHIEKDIKDIQSVLNVNFDEVLLFCHHLLDSIVVKSTDSEQSPVHSWKEKEDRRKWENEFDKEYIRPVLKDSIGVISAANEFLKENNELVIFLCERKQVDADANEQDEILCKNEMFWMYRVPVTLTHMKQVFQRECLADGSSTKYPLLKRFYDEEHVLKAIRFIPSILKLHRVLLRKYSYRCYKKDIKNISVGELRQEKVAGDETDTLVEHVKEAWDITRKVIISRNHVCTSKFGRIFVPKELCDKPISDDTSVVDLLPNTDDTGICTYAMLEVLMKIQNEFLEEYVRMSRRNGAEVKLSIVCPKEVTSAHLVSFDPVIDIQPLILANCSFHVKDSNISYDFENFEKQILDRFVSTKSEIKTEPFIEIDQMVYRADFSVSDVMMILESKIRQERITPAMRNQICGEIKVIPDICQILSSLDIAIRVLNVTGGEPDSLLFDFMTEKLKMNQGVLTTKMQQLCKLCHVKSLWMTLSVQKAFIMVTHDRNSKEIFESVGEINHEPLPMEVQTQFNAFLMRQSSERLQDLLDFLFEYIILQVSQKMNEDDEDYFDESHYELKDCIYSYAEGIDKETALEFVIWKDESSIQFNFPSEILQKHCLHAWIAVAKQITNRKSV